MGAGDRGSGLEELGAGGWLKSILTMDKTAEFKRKLIPWLRNLEHQMPMDFAMFQSKLFLSTVLAQEFRHVVVVM